MLPNVLYVRATRMTLQWCVALSMVLMQLSDTAGLIYFVLEMAIRSRTVLTKLRKEMKKFISVLSLHGLQEAPDGNTVNFMRGFWIWPSQDIFSELRLVQVQSVWIQLIFFMVISKEADRSPVCHGWTWTAHMISKTCQRSSNPSRKWTLTISVCGR